jgi:hypothetical protein
VKASDYRARVEKELGGESGEVREAGRLRAAAITGDPLSLDERRDLVRDSIGQRGDLPTAIPALIGILADAKQPEELRTSALDSLKAAAFVVTAFAPYRAEFLETLHKTLPEAGQALRERALETLAIEKDKDAQALLVKGLRDPSKALVPPAVALQYLGYDDHGGYESVVRDVVAKSDNDDVRYEGLRLLASDPKSCKLFERLFSDKNEKSEIRRLGASALQMLAPDTFEKLARRILADDKDYDEIRATALGALTHVREFARARADPKLVAKVDDLRSKARGFLRDAAAQFVKRSG